MPKVGGHLCFSISRAWDSRFLEYKSPKTKNSIRKIPLSASLNKKLQISCDTIRPQSNQLVFTFSDNPFSLSTLTNRYLHQDIDRLGLPKLNFHGLRHCFGTSLARKGIPVSMIMRLMGHTQLSTTMRYIRLAAMDIELPEKIKQIDTVNLNTRNGKVFHLNV